MVTLNRTSRSRRRAPRGLASAVALAAAVSLVPQAFAHAGVTFTSPANGATVRVLPTFVKVTFDEVLGSVTSVRVIDAKGKDHVVTAGLDPRNAARVIAKTTKPALGRYVVRWSVVADDGHKETGTFRFTVKR